MAIETANLIPIPVPPKKAGFQPPGAPGQLLSVQFIAQSESNWCWAACGEMLIRFYRLLARSQCDLASAMSGLTCCSKPLAVGCDLGAWPEVEYPKHGLSVDQEWRPFSPVELDAQLSAKAPVEVYFEWNGGGAHVALIVGRRANGDYVVHDPGNGTGPRSHQTILSGYGAGAWTMTYRTGVI